MPGVQVEFEDIGVIRLILEDMVMVIAMVSQIFNGVAVK